MRPACSAAATAVAGQAAIDPCTVLESPIILLVTRQVSFDCQRVVRLCLQTGGTEECDRKESTTPPKRPSLTMLGVSRAFLSTLLPALRGKRHFAFFDNSPSSTPGSRLIFRAALSPTQPSRAAEQHVVHEGSSPSGSQRLISANPVSEP